MSEQRDIEERLRTFAAQGAGVAVLIDAATEIASLRAKLESARKALEMIERTTFSGSEMSDAYLRGNREAHEVCAGMARAALTDETGKS